MNLGAAELIGRKQRGEKHTPEEIAFLVEGYLRGTVPDYQMAAWLMAVYFRGLDSEETWALTRLLVDSGEVLNLESVPGIKVDKHSTGGVGDKTTLVVVPLAAACGLTVVKLAGRSLGHTGGTLDKLEAIPGMRVELSREEIISQATRIGMVLAGHTAELVPADRKLYALRDVTATAECPPLIAASIMSKKIAGGAQVIVLDVKVGEGGFLPGLEEGRNLARAMVELGRRAGRPAAAVLSRMDQPLGRAVGNALEVEEAVEVLQGRGPADVRELSLVLTSQLLVLAGKVENLEKGRELAEEGLDQGRAWEKFRQLVSAQGGRVEVLEAGGLAQARYRVPIVAAREGYVQKVAARSVGEAARVLGAGRQALGQAVDPAVGIVVLAKTGDYVTAGQPLAVIHAQDRDRAETLAGHLASAWEITEYPPPYRPLVFEYWS
ncbi:MAG: thymidine phosphorylase [Moorellales bacterium]